MQILRQQIAELEKLLALKDKRIGELEMALLVLAKEDGIFTKNECSGDCGSCDKEDE